MERAIQDGEAGKPDTMTTLLAAVRAPYSEDEAFAVFEQAPDADEVVTQTFCGT